MAAIGEVDALAARALDEHQVPGMAIVVLREDELLLARGYGQPDVTGDVSASGSASGSASRSASGSASASASGSASAPANVSATTVFQLGSISKQFLAALVVALADDGVLSLDDAVAGHLPDFTTLPPTLHVRHLLNHTSGVRELFTLPEAEHGFDDLTMGVDALRAAVRRAPVDFEPGSRWSYSNTNYTLLAFIVERLTGVPYHEALAQRFFRPLQLASLRQCTPLPAQDDEARGHVRRNGTVMVAAPENMNWAWGDGGLCGNAMDVARWTRLLATGGVISTTSYALMTTPSTLPDGRAADYGHAISLVAMDGLAKRAHNGAMAGFSASAAYYPASALTVVVLTNRGDVRSEVIERDVARRVLGHPQPAFTEHVTSPAERARVAGTYDIGVFDVVVVDRDGQLWLEVPAPGPTTPLRHLGDGVFAGAIAPDAYRVTFSNGAGPAQEVRLFMAAMHWYGVRRP
jgi:D-alanyl-D-alanine carboxypeptidase